MHPGPVSHTHAGCCSLLGPSSLVSVQALELQVDLLAPVVVVGKVEQGVAREKVVD